MSYEDQIMMEVEADEQLQINADPSFDEEPDYVVEPQVHHSMFN